MSALNDRFQRSVGYPVRDEDGRISMRLRRQPAARAFARRSERPAGWRGASASDRTPRRGGARWIDVCTRRLAELRPADDRAFLGAIAADLWQDVGAFDPCLAAEIEHESWPAPATRRADRIEPAA